MTVNIKIEIGRIDLSSNLFKVMEDTMLKTSQAWMSSNSSDTGTSLFSNDGNELVLSLIYRKIEHKRDNSIVSPVTYKPVSHLSKQPNSRPQWGRMNTTPTIKPWKQTNLKDTKIMDIRNAHFDKPLSIDRRSSNIQDTFLEVFGTNANHILGGKGGL